MSGHQLGLALLDLAGGVVGFALNWLLQSTLLICTGLFAARLASRRGSAAQSVIYRTTLAAVLICPSLTWALSISGFAGWALRMPLTRNDRASIRMVGPASETALRTSESAVIKGHDSNRAGRGADLAAAPARSSAPTSADHAQVTNLPLSNGDDDASPPSAGTVSPLRKPQPATGATTLVPLSRFVPFSIAPFGVFAIGVSLLWLSISSSILARLTVAWCRLAQIRRAAVPAESAALRICRELSFQLGVAPPAVLHSPFLPSPCLAGVLEPAVLLPEAELPISLRHVLVHELAHLCRHDGHWNLLRQLATGLFWFQPLLWILSRRIEITAEEVCDDFVVEAGLDPVEYAHRLVDVAELASVPMATAGVAIVSLRSMLARRVTRIMDPTRRLSTRVSRVLLVAALAGGCFGTLIIGFVGAAPRSPVPGKPVIAKSPVSAAVHSHPLASRDLAPEREVAPLESPVSVGLLPASDPLAGMISSPATLPENRRWQMFTKYPGQRSTNSVSWSPDGRWLAMATGRVVRIFEVTANAELRKILVGHDEVVNVVRFSPDGNWIATGSHDRTVRIWDAEGHERFVFRDHGDAVNDVCWHPDGDRLASASFDGTVRIWSKDGQSLACLTDHHAFVNAVAWSPDGNLLASGSQNGEIRYWSADGTSGPIARGHLSPVKSLAWNFDGSRLLSCDLGIDPIDQKVSDLAYIKIWNRDGRPVNSVSVDHRLSQVCWSPDGKVAVAGGSFSFTLWRVGARQPVVRIGTAGMDVPVAWRPGSEVIAAGPLLFDSRGQNLNLMRMRSLLLCGLGRSPDGALLGVGSSNGTFSLFGEEGQRLRLPTPVLDGSPNWVQTIRWSPDGKTFIPGTRYHRGLRPFDVTGNDSGNPVKLPADCRSVDWSRDGRYVAAGGDDTRPMLVDLRTQEVTELGKHAHGITHVRFTPDQEQICSAGFDGCVRFWSRRGQALKVLETESAIRGLALANDGELLATGHEDQTIRFWNAQGKTTHVLEGHGGFVESLEFNPAGTLLASGSWDNTVRIWKRDGSPVSVLRGHEGAVFAVEWTPDGRGLYSCGEDGAIRRWDVATGKTEWQALVGASGEYVTLDASGKVTHGDERILDSDFVFFAEDDEDRLVRTEWREIRDAIQPAGALAGRNDAD